MKLFIALAALGALAADAVAQTPGVARQVWEDAKVVRRVVEVSRRDMPKDVLKKILEEDLDLLRGKRGDYEYDYATFQRIENGRKEEGVTAVSGKKEDDLTAFTIKDNVPFRLDIAVPSRRMLLFGNNKVWIERVEVSWTPLGGGGKAVETIPVAAYVERGDTRRIDLPEIGRDTTVTVMARVDPEDRKASFVMRLIEARLVDDSQSPWAAAVRRVLALYDAVREEEYRRARDVANELIGMLEPEVGGLPMMASAVDPIAPVQQPVTTPGGLQPPPIIEIYIELQSIEDMLTGGEAERRRGLDKLHQLVRRLRQYAP